MSGGPEVGATRGEGDGGRPHGSAAVGRGVGSGRSEAGPRGDTYVFVGGPPRSGTTLLQNVLDSHPDVCGAPELYHLKDVVALRAKLHRSLARGWLGDFCSRESADDLVASFIEELLRPVREKYGGRLLSEKTPANVLVFRELMELFPGAHFLFMVRDPRAVVASLLRVGRRADRNSWRTPRFTRSLPHATAHVHRCLDAGFAAAGSSGDRVRTVLYERLVTEPEVETRDICRFLGLTWSETMVRPRDTRHPGEGDIVNDVWYDRDEYRRNPDPTGIDRWKEELTPAQQAYVVAAFGDHPELDRLGYRLTLEDLPPMRRLAGRISAAGPRAARSMRRMARSLRSGLRSASATGRGAR